MNPSRELITRPLTSARLAQIYPLVQLAHPNWSRGSWESFARDHLYPQEARTRGCFVVEDQNNTILGLLVFDIQDRPPSGLFLEAKVLIAMDSFPSGRTMIANRLVHAAEETARRAACDKVLIRIEDALGDPLRGWWVTFLEGHGYGAGGPVLSKPL